MAEIRRAKEIFDDFEAELSLFTIVLFEKTENNPEAMSDEEIELTRRGMAHTLKVLETGLSQRDATE